MPIIKKRPHIIELLDIAVDQRRKLHDTKVEILQRPALIWYQNYGNDDSTKTIFKQGTLLYSYTNYLWIKLIIISRYCEKLLTDKYTGYARLIIWPIALAILTYEAQNQNNNSKNNTEATVFATLDIVINCWFIVDALFRLIGTVIRVKIEKAFGRDMKYLEIFQGCGFLDLIVSSFNFGLGITTAGLWIRLVRLILITNAVLDKIPHISVLFSGISNGLKSILFTVILLFLEIAIWASFGNFFFRKNDPFYFGTYGLALLSFFQVTTFESWNDLYNVNANGCDEFTGAFYTNAPKATTELVIDTGYGLFYFPVCSNPVASPITASVLFVTYVLVGSYIMISMNLAAVSIGINERLLSLRTLQLYGDGGEMSTSIRGNSVPRRLNKASNKASDNKINKLLGNKDDTRYYTMILQNLWSGNTAMNKMFGSNEMEEFSLRRLSWVRLQAMAKRLLRYKMYEVVILVFIMIDLIVQMQDQTYEEYESSR